jgi:hypothetical protein
LCWGYPADVGALRCYHVGVTCYHIGLRSLAYRVERPYFEMSRLRHAQPTVP